MFSVSTVDDSDGAVSCSSGLTYDLHVCVLWCLAGFGSPISQLQLGQTIVLKNMLIYHMFLYSLCSSWYFVLYNLNSSLRLP